MIGIDTNVLVRFFVRDDVAQLEAASRCLAKECTAESPGFVNRLVLCEFVWVLMRVYRIERSAIVAALDNILRAEELLVEDEALAEIALQRFRDGAIDFADCMIALVNEREGCATTRSFDRVAVRDLPQFSMVEGQGAA